MARSRLIACSLSTSARFFSLFEIAGPLAEFCQSLYPLVVVHSDDHGRMAGDGFTVKMTCHPSSPRSIEEFNNALAALDASGLIRRDVHEGSIYLQVVDFDAFQSGLHKRRPSKFPEIPGNSRKNQVELELDTESDLDTEQNRNNQVQEQAHRPRRCVKPVENSKLMLKLAHEVISSGVSEPERKDALKQRCAQSGVAYDADSIRKALDSVESRRAK